MNQQRLTNPLTIYKPSVEMLNVEIRMKFDILSPVILILRSRKRPAFCPLILAFHVQFSHTNCCNTPVSPYRQYTNSQYYQPKYCRLSIAN